MYFKKNTVCSFYYCCNDFKFEAIEINVEHLSLFVFCHFRSSWNL